jgi:cell division protein FtsB
VNDRSWNTATASFRVPWGHPATFGLVNKLLHYIPQPIRNRYGITALALVAWVALFDRNDLWTNWKNQRELGRMQEQQEWYAAEIQRTREQLQELGSDKRLLEKFARERYLMKRDNEDIFVLVPEKKR